MNKQIIQDGIYGLIIGDALGVPYEFKSPQELQKNPVTDMIGYGTWGQPLGTWSDDTALTLATMNSIIKNNGNINLDHMMKEYVKWITQGDYMQNQGIEPFDYGNTTSNAILNYIDGMDVYNCGLTDEYSNGNGSLMRMLPLAFLDTDYQTIAEVSGLTHAHMRCQIGCNLYVEIAKQIIQGGEDTFCDYVSKASEKIIDYYRNEKELEYYHRIFEVDYTDGVTGKTHIVDTLESAIYSIRVAEDYRSSVLTAVNIGNDTDTVGAVCGGLAGLYYGYDDIPSEWISNVYNKKIVEDICENYSQII